MPDQDTNAAPDLLVECEHACAECASQAEGALLRDPSYTAPGTERFSLYHLALLSCASACRITAGAAVAGACELSALAPWCAEMALRCAELTREHDARFVEQLEAACMRCVTACERIQSR